jgi:hypothetical protein
MPNWNDDRFPPGRQSGINEYSPDSVELNKRHKSKYEDLFSAIERFISEFENREREVPLVNILRGEKELEGEVIRQAPERFMEDYLIWEVLEILGYEYTPRPVEARNRTEEIPDFRIDNVTDDYCLVGENKKLNQFESAEEDLESYLELVTRAVGGIATDGITWKLYIGQEDVKISIEESVRKVVNERVHSSKLRYDEEKVEFQLKKFIDIFSKRSVDRYVEEFLSIS